MSVTQFQEIWSPQGKCPLGIKPVTPQAKKPLVNLQYNRLLKGYYTQIKTPLYAGKADSFSVPIGPTTEIVQPVLVFQLLYNDAFHLNIA